MQLVKYGITYYINAWSQFSLIFLPAGKVSISNIPSCGKVSISNIPSWQSINLYSFLLIKYQSLFLLLVKYQSLFLLLVKYQSLFLLLVKYQSVINCEVKSLVLCSWSRWLLSCVRLLVEWREHLPSSGFQGWTSCILRTPLELNRSLWNTYNFYYFAIQYM